MSATTGTSDELISANNTVSGKYIPPHRRNTSNDNSRNKSRDNIRSIERRRSQDKSNVVTNPNTERRDNLTNNSNEIQKPRRRDLSQGSKFNTKSISEDNKSSPIDLESIEIPETIVPIKVDQIINETPSEITDELLNKVINGDISKSIPTPGPSPTIEKNSEKSGALYEYEIEFIKKIVKLRAKNARREARKNYNEWVKYYSDDLEHMYEICVDSDLEFPYDEFVQLAYRCTEKEFNPKKLKYTRPLI
jgi:hypothetical protein